MGLSAAPARNFTAAMSFERPLKNDAFQLFWPDVKKLIAHAKKQSSLVLSTRPGDREPPSLTHSYMSLAVEVCDQNLMCPSPGTLAVGARRLVATTSY